MAELAAYLHQGPPPLDYITLAGSGEPTLNLGLGRIIRHLKALTGTPVAVLTNGALLYLPEVRDELRPADLVLPSLDAAREETFPGHQPAPAGLPFKQADRRPGSLPPGVSPAKSGWRSCCSRDLTTTEADLEALRRALQQSGPGQGPAQHRGASRGGGLRPAP